MASDSTRSAPPLAIALFLALAVSASGCETLLGFGDEPGLRPPSEVVDSGHDAVGDEDASSDATVESDAVGGDSSTEDSPVSDADVSVPSDVGPADGPDAAPSGGHILFSVGIENQRIRRVAAHDGATFEEVGEIILAANPPIDPDASFTYPMRRATLSHDGAFVALTSTLWSPVDEWTYVLSTATWQKQFLDVAEIGGPGSSGAPSMPALVGNGGVSAVYGYAVAASWDAGALAFSLFRTTRASNTDATWAAPVRLFPDSFEMKSHVIGDVSSSSALVLSACGNQVGVIEPSEAICESDYSGASPVPRVVARASDTPVSHPVQFSHPVYDADDNVVFSANWIDGSPNLKQVWRVRRNGGQLERVSPAGRYDRTPCVLPDGRIVSVFKDGNFEKLRVMNADGAESFIVETGAAADEVVAVELGPSCSN